MLRPVFVAAQISAADEASMGVSLGHSLRLLARAGARYLTTLHAAPYGLECWPSAEPPVAGPPAAGPPAGPSGRSPLGPKAGPEAGRSRVAAAPEEATEEVAAGEEGAVERLCAASLAAGLPRHGVGLFSAHQMGSCRMGSDPRGSVVDCDGESWDVDDL